MSPARTLQPVADLDFHDVQSILLPVAVTPLEAWNLMTGAPRPLMRLAFRLRDAISAPFGVKRIGGYGRANPKQVRAGERLDFFLVEHAEPDVLILTERDRHLDVMICIATEGRRLTITASVVTHNAFGRLYILPVAPAHRRIVRHDLKLLQRILRGSVANSAAP